VGQRDAARCCNRIPTFRRTLLLPSSGQNNLEIGNVIYSDTSRTFTRLHGVIACSHSREHFKSGSGVRPLSHRHFSRHVTVAHTDSYHSETYTRFPPSVSSFPLFFCALFLYLSPCSFPLFAVIPSTPQPPPNRILLLS
jgi:hypothetical protein